MKTLNLKLTLATLVCLGGFLNEANALPMFESQAGLSCKACHTQNQPTLGKIGRDFALGGMTLTQVLGQEDGQEVHDLGVSLMVKSRYEKTSAKPNSVGLATDDVDTNDGVTSIPRTASLIAGGRVSDNVGTLVTASYKDREDNSLGGKVVFVKPLGDGYLGTAVYSTANYGPFSGMEVYNTGLYKPLRTFEIMSLANINQAASVGTGKATGMQVYATQNNAFFDSDHIFASIGFFSPSQDDSDIQLVDNFMPFARVAYEYQVGDFNFMIGGFAIVGGSTAATSADDLRVERETYGMDIQIEGVVAQKNVTVTATKVFRNDINYTGNLNSIDDLEDRLGRGFSIDTQVEVVNDLSLKLAYMEYNDMYIRDGGTGSVTNHMDVYDLDRAITVGLDYSFKYYLPMTVTVEHGWAVPALDRVENYRDFVVTLNILF